MSSSSLFTSLGAALQNFSSPRFSLRGSSSPTARSNPGLNAFESELVAQLEDLKSTDDAGYLAIPWLCRAMGAVIRTHASLKASLPDLQQGVSEGDTRWLDEYLDDSVKLLDVCSALRDAIEDLKRYNVLIELALHTFGSDGADSVSITEARLRRAKTAIAKCTDAVKKRDEEVSQRRSRLENCSSMLRRMGEKINTEDAMKGNFFTAIYAAQITTIFLCGVLTAALSFRARRPLSSIAIAGQSAWSFSLSSLQQRVKEHAEKKKSKGACTLLEELEKTDTIVRCLQDIVEKLLQANVFPVGAEQATEVRQLLKTLYQCLIELSQGLAPLEVHVGEVYKSLISSRMVLLDIYSHL